MCVCLCVYFFNNDLRLFSFSKKSFWFNNYNQLNVFIRILDSLFVQSSLSPEKYPGMQCFLISVGPNTIGFEYNSLSNLCEYIQMYISHTHIHISSVEDFMFSGKIKCHISPASCFL